MAGQAFAIKDLKSFRFPLARGPRGFFDMAVEEDCIRQNCQQIVGTPLGTRVMRPLFGCDIWSQPFEPNDATTHANISGGIKRALELWEPRIQVVAVNVPPVENGNTLKYEVRYRIKATGTFDGFGGDLPTRQ